MRAGATRLSRNGSADHSYKISCYQADKEQLPLSAKAYLPGRHLVRTGLGLWVSKSIVQKHDGFIQVRSSVRPGQSGTVFSVFLPESEPTSVAA